MGQRKETTTFHTQADRDEKKKEREREGFGGKKERERKHQIRDARFRLVGATTALFDDVWWCESWMGGCC